MSDHSALQDQWEKMIQWLNHWGHATACPFRFPELNGIASELGLPMLDVEITSAAAIEFPKREPALKNVDTKLLGALQYALGNDLDDARIQAWSTKLLRVCELRRTELKRRTRHGDETAADGRQKVLWLCLFFLEHFQIHEDARYVNLVLKILDQNWLRADLPQRKWSDPPGGWLDVLIVLVHALLVHALSVISRENWRTEVRFSCDDRMDPKPSLPMKAMFEDEHAPGVVVFSPNPYSLYTLSVLQLLVLHGVHVQGIALRRLINRKRLIQEFKRDGLRLIKKVWNKLILRKKAYAPRAYQTLPQFMEELGVTHKDVAAWAEDHGVPVWYCDTLNDDHVIEALKDNSPQAVVFTGGGLIRDPVLEASGAGVINTHMGLLPPYRGMDVVEWPILEGWSQRVGVSVHFMARGLDEGDILVMHHAPRDHTQDIHQLRERMEVLAPQASVSATLRFLQGRLEPRSQPRADGKQYFIMHPRLYNIALKRYQRSVAGQSHW